MHDGVRPEVLRFCVAAPASGWLVDGDVSVHVGQAVAFAALIGTGAARVAAAAGLEHLDRDPVAGRHTPTLRGRVTDALDHTHGLVPGDELEPAAQVPRVLLVVGPAQPARFDAEDCVIVAVLWDG